MDATDFFDAAPVETVETLERESKDVLDWLGKRVKELVKAVDQPREAPNGEESNASTPLAPEDIAMYVLEDRPRAWTFAQIDAIDKKALFREIAGETIIVDVRLGGLDENGLPRRAKGERSYGRQRDDTTSVPSVRGRRHRSSGQT